MAAGDRERRVDVDDVGARGSPLSETIAWFSCAELPSGLSFVIVMPYFFENVDMISP